MRGMQRHLLFFILNLSHDNFCCFIGRDHEQSFLSHLPCDTSDFIDLCPVSFPSSFFQTEGPQSFLDFLTQTQLLINLLLWGLQAPTTGSPRMAVAGCTYQKPSARSVRCNLALGA